ncbi:MAG: Ca-activated chloride channel family protein, partial [Candidatus Paceibacteria bacterium]
MYQLEEPIYFYILLAIPLVLLLYVLVSVWKKRV